MADPVDMAKFQRIGNPRVGHSRPLANHCRDRRFARVAFLESEILKLTPSVGNGPNETQRHEPHKLATLAVVDAARRSGGIGLSSLPAPGTIIFPFPSGARGK